MILTLVLVAIGLLLFLVIIYNIFQQYRQKQDTEKRALLMKHKHIISEAEELLLNASQIPYSRTLVSVLHQRILTSLQSMLQQDPRNSQLNARINNTRQQLEQLKEGFPGEQEGLRAPESDQQAIHMLKVVKRLRGLLRIEHNNGKVGTQTFINEDRRLELIQLKINLSNLLKRSRLALENREAAMARQMLEKGKKVLEQVSDKDEQLRKVEETIQKWLDEMTRKQHSEMEQKEQEEQQEEKSELDLLFEPKRKW
ncbi:DNA repair ATPase [Zobellella taiwanensis]|jgi:hypothetical protein|uniref:DNA repair ATPase n=1 Tax=Zobellella taiwanensis TaxID=347535 RepID=A0A2P7RAK2_9GAMM|nr:DNA repair ATPase [Zobellella taiwanensis]PSJ47192.1 DNA repair ATPase [Zobellella taiwanensis]